MNILVLCTGNSARSILLESALNTRGARHVTAYSAGSRPAGQVNPEALKLLSAKGYVTEGASSQSWDDYALDTAPKMDLVITVCASAAGEVCPLWPGAPVTAHWGVDDPAGAEDEPSAFARAFRQLDACAAEFLSHKPWTLTPDALKALVRKIEPDQ